MFLRHRSLLKHMFNPTYFKFYRLLFLEKQSLQLFSSRDKMPGKLWLQLSFFDLLDGHITKLNPSLLSEWFYIFIFQFFISLILYTISILLLLKSGLVDLLN